MWYAIQGTLFGSFVLAKDPEILSKGSERGIRLTKVEQGMPWPRLTREPGSVAPTMADFEELMQKMNRLEKLGVIKMQGSDA